MAVNVDLTYEGGLRTCAVHGPSGTTITIDAPLDNHGRGESFSPTDLVATALGACMLTLMGIAAEPRGIDLAGATVHVEKHMIADPDRRIGTIVVALRLPVAPDPRQREVLERAAHTCPVMKSLDPRVEKIVTFAWGA